VGGGRRKEEGGGRRRRREEAGQCGQCCVECYAALLIADSK